MVMHKKEVSDKVIIILLVLAILFSVGGSLIVYETVQGLKGDFDYSKGISSSTGLVSLEVISNTNVGELK